MMQLVIETVITNISIFADIQLQSSTVYKSNKYLQQITGKWLLKSYKPDAPCSVQ